MSDTTTAQTSSRRSGRVRPEISYKERDDKDNYDELRRAQGYTVKRQRKYLPRKGHQNEINNGDEDAHAICADQVPDLLDDVLNFPPEELEAYEGWVELESDPASRKLPDSDAHFNYILHTLGVSNVRSEEIFSMDETEIAALSRLDLMDADLGMMNQWEERNKRQNKGKSSKRKRKALDPDSAKHYVGYIPHDGKLWELDGLDGGVICLGPYEGDWACAVIPHIQRKVEELGLQANLLALSHNPLASVRQKLAVNMACYKALQQKLAASPTLKNMTENDETYITCKQENAEQLKKMGLTYEEVVATPAPQEFLNELNGPEMIPEYADTVMRRLRAEQRDLKLEYNAARESGNEDLAAARRRCQDYTPLVHGWLRAMGEAGVLEALADSQ
ncbi:uncharacterized protein PpBr36_06652 [Pyricularia pennisetigena]|uniref:uncharacterized protein n=1 Tax=Pyricularia pennisetigena TaxID=1578925 RepID=UPI00114EF8F5|nr:uncharacterized protein PpBr36_06652 [Pyricularia pennisetigena]TLS23153.1 hypothetical protein PpBr36_06652 [Pyricularia pennisetigena]